MRKYNAVFCVVNIIFKRNLRWTTIQSSCVTTLYSHLWLRKSENMLLL